jgi:hypothetical protein
MSGNLYPLFQNIELAGNGELVDRDGRDNFNSGDDWREDDVDSRQVRTLLLFV